jgi:DNA invertase Pin-like site-specific DNA recombinase
MLNILASFAEFEREMIASRVTECRVRLKLEAFLVERLPESRKL